MKRLLLLGALGYWGTPLLAQPQLAMRTDTVTVDLVRTPILGAVRQACQRYLPELATDSAAVWTAGFGEFAASSERTLIYYYQSHDISITDTLKYHLTAYFDSTGITQFVKEVTTDSFPSPVRRAVQRILRRHSDNASILLGICDFRAAGFRQSTKQKFLYTVQVYAPEHPSRPDSYGFWRNGRLVLRNGEHVWRRRKIERSTRSVHIMFN